MPEITDIRRRPRVIVVGMLKGGSGKTTSAVMIASRYAALGEEVDLLDGDQTSQSSYDWARQAELAGNPLGFRVDRHPYVDDVVEEIRGRRDRGRRVVVDAGGGSAQYLEEVCSIADVLLVTLAPSGADARRLDATLRAAERGAARNPEGLDAYVALVRCDYRTSAPGRWADQLRDDERPLLDTTIRDLVLYSDAYGHRPEDVGEYEPLLAEVEAELAVPA
jgi:chromosome partitioning protein